MRIDVDAFKEILSYSWEVRFGFFFLSGRLLVVVTRLQHDFISSIVTLNISQYIVLGYSIEAKYFEQKNLPWSHSRKHPA